jgi:hypothetical protein
LTNLNPPLDGATFVDHGGDLCYTICKRGMKPGPAYALKLQVEVHGGPVNDLTDRFNTTSANRFNVTLPDIFTDPSADVIIADNGEFFPVRLPIYSLTGQSLRDL